MCGPGVAGKERTMKTFDDITTFASGVRRDSCPHGCRVSHAVAIVFEPDDGEPVVVALAGTARIAHA
jgi:hypothetical protein